MEIRMKTLTTAAVVLALATPALAEGDDASAKSGDAGSAKASSTSPSNDPGAPGMNSRGQGSTMQRPMTSGAASQGMGSGEIKKTPGDAGAPDGAGGSGSA